MGCKKHSGELSSDFPKKKYLKTFCYIWPGGGNIAIEK